MDKVLFQKSFRNSVRQLATVEAKMMKILRRTVLIGLSENIKKTVTVKKLVTDWLKLDYKGDTLQSVAHLLEISVDDLVENLVTKIFEIPNIKPIRISIWEFKNFDEITIQELLSLRSIHSEKKDFYLATEDPDETFERAVQRLSNSYQSIIDNDGCNAQNLCIEIQLDKLFILTNFN